MSSATMKVDRREFLKGAAAGAAGLVIGFYLPDRLEARASAAAEAAPFAPNAWIRIGTDDTVTLVIDKSEMGQGVVTLLSMLIAEDTGVRLEKDSHGVCAGGEGIREPRIWTAGNGREHECERDVDAAADGRSASARDVDRRGCRKMGRG